MAEEPLIDRSEARRALLAAQGKGKKFPLRPMRHMLKAMLEDAHIMAMATGSIGGSSVEAVGDMELEVSFHWRKGGQVHDVCLSGPKPCPLCAEGRPNLLLEAAENVLKMMGDSGVGWANVLDNIRGYDAGRYGYDSVGFYARTLIDLRAAVEQHTGKPSGVPVPRQVR